MRSKIWKLMTLAVIALVVIGGIGGCSDSNAECKVTYDAKEDSFEIIVNPPGEPGDFTQGGTIKRTTVGDAGQRIIKSTYEVNLERTYIESGNTYEILGSIKPDDSGNRSKLVGYTLTITGGV